MKPKSQKILAIVITVYGSLHSINSSNSTGSAILAVGLFFLAYLIYFKETPQRKKQDDNSEEGPAQFVGVSEGGIVLIQG